MNNKNVKPMVVGMCAGLAAGGAAAMMMQPKKKTGKNSVSKALRAMGDVMDSVTNGVK